ncbi:MAG: hypothetical protein IT204_11790 [Fimbriimonadaceae bacterium]|nr:hypothetical protein [Fimbriimonadaceae bacterium]
MRRVLVWGLILLAGLPALAQQPAAPAAPAAAAVPRVSVEWVDVPVREALRQLTARTGIDFVVATGVDGGLTARFQDEAIDKILRLIARTLGCEVRLIEDVFILRPLPAVEPAATGAAALLPGAAPGGALPATPAPTPGDAPLVGGPGEVAGGTTQPAAKRREVIGLNYRTPAEMAALLGGAYIGPDGTLQQPGQGAGGAAAGGDRGDPYRNLPPDARVTKSGTIIMPNGTIVTPGGTIVAPNGTIVQPRRPAYLRVPYGTNPEDLFRDRQREETSGTLSGNLGGVPFSTDGNGLSVGGLGLNLGGNGTLTLPGIRIGGQRDSSGYPNTRFNGDTTTTTSSSVYRWGLPANWHFDPRP